MPGRRVRTRFALAAVVLLLVGGLAMGLVSGVFGRWLGGTPTSANSPAATPGVTGSATPSPSAAPQSSLTPVLAAAAGTDDTSKAALADRIKAVETKMGGRWTGSVVDLSDGRALYSKDHDRGYAPASTMKLLTTVSALQLLGPQHRFSTTVVAGSGDQIVLVGGGDPYLALKSTDLYPERASITTLANRTAAALAAAGRTRVTLRYDTSLFSGPARNPKWPGTYADQVTSLTPLWVDEGRVTRFGDGPRVADPTGDAVEAFRAALQKKGIAVRSTSAGRAPQGAKALASVPSAPLAEIVRQVLLTSDNDGAEVLFRQVARAAGQPASFTGGVAGVRKALKDLGVWVDGTTIYDGSGLARENRVSADLLTKIITAAASPDRPQLRPLLTGLPTAAVDGSLRYRYDDGSDEAGRGLLRAKTGTLSKVHSLAGYVLARDGSLLGFAFITNDVKNDYDAVQWLDHVTAAVAGCGCT